MPFIYDLTDTWTDAGVTYTSVKMDVTDTASDAASLLLDLLVAGSSKFSIDKNGNVTLVGTVDGVDVAALSSTVNGLHGVASSGSYNDLNNKPFIPASIEDLNDVAAMTPGTGDVLTWSGSSWESDTPDAVITTIGGLTDVTVATPSTSHVLRYNGTNWENAQLGYGELSGTPTLATVATSGSYNDLQNKPFIPADLNDLSDVVIGTAALGEVIRYDGANWVDAQLSYNDLSNKPSVPADIDDLSDVTITTPATNEFLAYDGAGWINTTTLNTGTEDAVINGVDIGTGPGTGSNNTRVGEDALSSQTTGAGNVAVGRNALSVLTTGSSNTAVGLSAMYNATGTTNSTAVGRAALHDITTGGFNTALGDSAGFNTTTGQQNITIGYNARSTSATTSHEITLGNSTAKSFRIPGSSFYINGGSEGTTGTRVGVNTATPAAQLHVNGAAQVDGAVTADGLTVDTNTLHVDATNNRVGIGTTSPATALDVTGTITADGLNLGDIHKTENITAVDVFVYDTSKDSDGGAWRHRTQHTSWYAEASSASRDVNTRSTRAEFPSVAVIVAEANKVTIYDGDDPSLPMWMVFNGDNSYGSTRLLRVTNDATGNSISAINGSICVTSARNDGGLVQFNMISEFGRYHTAAPVVGNNAAWRSTISARNGAGLWVNDGLQGIVNYFTNDVAMTVLPDAPTDPATGLPVPTIACLVAETKVLMADGSTKRLDQVQPGEMVKTLEGEHRVLNWWDQGIKDVIELEFEGRHKITCTADHKIRTTTGWVEAGDLTEDHEVVVA